MNRQQRNAAALLKKMSKQQPAGKCPLCKKDGLIFGQYPGDDPVPADKGDGLYLQGGFVCPHCGFGNSGALRVVQ